MADSYSTDTDQDTTFYWSKKIIQQGPVKPRERTSQPPDQPEDSSLVTSLTSSKELQIRRMSNSHDMSMGLSIPKNDDDQGSQAGAENAEPTVRQSDCTITNLTEDDIIHAVIVEDLGRI